MSAEDAAAKLATFHKKLAKVAKRLKDGSLSADEALAEETRLKKKISKWEKAAAEAAEDAGGNAQGEAANGKQQRKQKKRDHEAAAQDGAAADDAAADGKASKKQKKAAAAAANGHASANGAHHHHHHHHSKHHRKHAEVGCGKLATAGKPIVKSLYQEHPEVTALTADRVSELRNERQTTVEGFGPDDDFVAGGPTDIKPVLKFEHTGLPEAMLHATRNFVSPSPIQAQCWPIILAGRDLIGIAATGSGKTLGFGLPMLRHIAAQREGGVVSGKGPFAIVMAPTRELALQINQVLEDAGSQCNMRTVCVYGGVPKGPQVGALKGGVEIVVGTPGRMEDLLNDGVLQLKQVTYAVLDEADRMLDLGFEPHIRAIMGLTRADRQTLMFSATWPTAVQKLAVAFLSHPVKVTIGSQDLAASHSITQRVEVIEPHVRDGRLLDLLQQYHGGAKGRKNRVIIFVLYKKEAPRVEQLLTRKGWKAVAIHGDISQQQRTDAVEKFKSGTVPLLIATDVAARGLDIPDVEVVINYSFPLTTEDYVHRIGRTGRAGKTGIAHTFFCAGPDKPRAGELINVLREAGQEVPEDLLKFGTAVKKKESKMYGAHFRDVDVHAKATKVTFDDD
ncbi:hypothetical protein PLESTB_000847600 [Pleodorina starrii]|uniref:RNA helicase n=1 Tax=Pleodorina starrii TaxID=330485 RepID=A0A9W6BLU7_9CHLO|nr:hypothetical protein PLESTM_002092700 [Pleodorina starrii]GLC54293.1 hypothetical protein PLESTB_000847600 [Pleodorina starrii]